MALANHSNTNLWSFSRATMMWVRKIKSVFNKDFISLKMLFLLSLTINLIEFVIPIFLLHTFDRILPTKDLSTAIIFVSALVIFLFASTYLKHLRVYLTSFGAARFEHSRTKELIKNTIVDPIYYNIGVFHFNLTQIRNGKYFITGKEFTGFLDSPFIVLFLAYLYYLHPLLIVAPIITLFAHMLYLVLTSKEVSKAIHLKHWTEIENENLLNKVLDNITTIRKFGRINVFNNKFKSSQADIAKSNYQLSKYIHRDYNIAQLTLKFSLALNMAIGAYLLTNSEITLGTLVAAVFLTFQSVKQTNSITKLMARIHTENILQGFFIPPKKVIQKSKQKCIDNINSMVIPIYIEGKRLEVPFKKGDTVSLEEVSETARDYLFTPLLKTLRQKIIVNDHKLKEVDEISLYKKVAIINSNSNIWNGTVKENITSFGLITLEQARYYIEALGLDRALKKLPYGIETVVTTENTDNISEQIKSLIYITRKLALDPDIIILNEFEANVDHVTYVKLYNYISQIRDSKIILINSKDKNFLNLCNRDLLNNRINETYDHFI